MLTALAGPRALSLVETGTLAVYSRVMARAVRWVRGSFTRPIVAGQDREWIGFGFMQPGETITRTIWYWNVWGTMPAGESVRGVGGTFAIAPGPSVPLQPPAWPIDDEGFDWLWWQRLTWRTESAFTNGSGVGTGITAQAISDVSETDSRGQRGPLDVETAMYMTWQFTNPMPPELVTARVSASCAIAILEP